MFAPRRIDENNRLNSRQRWVVMVMNLLLIFELTLSMYLAQKDPANLTVVFLRTFLPLLATTLVGARILIRRLHSHGAVPLGSSQLKTD